MADELARNCEEVNRENRLAIRLLAIMGIPLSVANGIVQMALSSDMEVLSFFLRTSWVTVYFVVLLVVERWVIPPDFKHATALLYVVEAPVVICSILLGSVWDPNHQAITFFIFLMAMPMLVLDRPIRVMLITTAWVVLFLVACYLTKTPDIFERDVLHVFEFYLATVAVANVVIRVRIVALERLGQARHHLEHDELTDLRNRRSLERHAAECLDRPLMVLAAEIDQLSMYNDFYGHGVGNQVLVKFAKTLSEAFGYDEVYRYGGDEILCLAVDVTEQSCLETVEECRSALRDFRIDDLQIALTCTVGYAMGEPHTGEEFHQMIQLADIYVHKAKGIGRGQTVGGVFNEASLRAGKIESNVETHLRVYETNQLTGLPSMSFFISRSEEALSSIIDYALDPMVGFLNLSQMKAFNSEFGYAQGDELIKHAANLLKEAFPGRLVCCITGCQFGIMCYKAEIEPGMRALNEGLRHFKEGFPITCKGGFAKYDKGDSVISLIDQARVAERSIRDEAGVLFRFYDEQLDADVKFREYIVAHLDDAIESGFLEVYYQPIVRTGTRKICNEEALSRWNDPARGLLAPYSFIPPLEESRQIYKLSLHVVRQVLADFERKREQGFPLVPTSVNLSRHDFEQCDIVQEITDLVDASGFSHDMIRIEITESAFMKNQELLKREVARFRANGFQVWMDDFGSEYSTLSLLQDMDVDLIKIDMEFMRSSSDSGKNLIIVSSIIDMAKRMGVATLVEGVENEEHMGILRAMGCDKMQGFLFSKPLPLETILETARNGGGIPFEE